MKLSQINYDLQNAKEFEIKDPATGLSFDVPAFISIYHYESPAGKNIQLQVQREMIELVKAGKPKPPDKYFDKYIKDLVAGYRGFEDENGKELKFTPKNTELLLQNKIISDLVSMESVKLGNYLVK